MNGQSRYYMNQLGREDHELRSTLLAAANGNDREAAATALGSLQRVYYLRLPLVEARLGMGVTQAAPTTDAPDVGARFIAPDDAP